MIFFIFLICPLLFTHRVIILLSMRQHRLYSLTLLLISAACQPAELPNPLWQQPSYQQCFYELQKNMQKQHRRPKDGLYKPRINMVGDYEVEWQLTEEEKEKNEAFKTHNQLKKLCRTIYGLEIM